jgi:mono/diheme cytochrome c family protein
MQAGTAEMKSRVLMTGLVVGGLAALGLIVAASLSGQAAHAAGTVESSNPITGDKDAIAAGQTTFRARCAPCHGMRANGRGRGLPNSSDLTKFKRGYTKFVYIVKNGGKTMPPYGGLGRLDDDEINQVGAYLETLASRRAKWIDPPTKKSEAQPDVQPVVATAPPEYQTHLDHILKALGETPGGVGLLTILEQEARIAQQHAAFAVKDLEDYENIRLHVAHVRHAINPAKERSGAGPGKGYGVARAAKAVIAHMELAAATGDATDKVKAHAAHVISAANNIVFWCEKIVDKANQVTSGGSPISQAFFAEEIVERIQWILEGTDADGDGAVSWTKGEGGLAQIRQHLGFIGG